MKKFLIIIITAMVSIGTFAQQQTESMVANPFYLSFTDKNVSVNDIDWNSPESVTAFLKTYVTDIPDYYVFMNYRTNTDKLGFTHYDCQQMDKETGMPLTGRELIIHSDPSGRLVYITGDLWTKNTPSVNPSYGAKGVNGKNDQKFEIVTIGDKAYACRVERKGFKRIYTDVETGKVVYQQSLIANIDKATEKATLTGNPYYEDSEYMYEPTMTGALQDGKYVLQDPERKIYTIDFTDNVVANNCAKLGRDKLSEDELMGIISTGTADDIIKYGNNFESSTPDYGSEHNTLTARLKSVTIQYAQQLNYMYSDKKLSDEYRFEIRKCNDADLAWKESIISGNSVKTIIDRSKAWENGTKVAEATSKLTVTDSDLKFDFEPDDLVITTPSQERDNAFDEKTHDIYVAGLMNGDETLTLTYIRDRCQDDVDNIEFIIDTDTMRMPLVVERELIKAQPTIDIHWGLERTLDTYEKQFKIKSYNNQGSPVVALVNYNFATASLPNNSAASPYSNDSFGTMMFGLGGRTMEENNPSIDILGNKRFYPLVNISTIGHEFTHLVATKLNGGYEAMALNESYADIMGKMVERYSLKPHFYMSGDNEISTISWDVAPMLKYGKPQAGIRNMKDPGMYGDPKYYHGKNWDFAIQEMHTNAGVQNYWFYLLCNGGDITPEQGESVSITPIDRDSAEFITFGALMYFATSLTDYSMARKHSILAANMYFGENSQEVESVYKAWYAVGVGTDEWKPGDPTSSINAIYSNNSLSTTTATRKLLKDGKIVIIKNGKQYNTVGQEL